MTRRMPADASRASSAGIERRDASPRDDAAASGGGDGVPRPIRRPVRGGRSANLRRRLVRRAGPAPRADRGDAGAGPHADHPQHLARHLVRSLDQSLSRLRARLRLLLRAAEPCLCRPVAGPRFRDQAVPQGRMRRACWSGAVGAGLPARHHRAGHGHRPLPADRARASRHPRGAGGAGALPPSRRHRDEIEPRHARHRHPGRDGAGRPRRRSRSR